jgi:hypothetical protein
MDPDIPNGTGTGAVDGRDHSSNVIQMLELNRCRSDAHIDWSVACDNVSF